MPRLVADRPILHATSDLGRIMQAARDRERAGERICHLERGEPDFDTPPHIVEAMARAVREGRTHHYPDPRGTAPLREALAEKLSRENSIAAHPDDVVVTVGGTHALQLAMQALLGPGDEMLVLSPHWMAIPPIVSFVDGARARPLAAYLELHSGAWSPADFATALREAVRPETRGVYVNTPNNPTGAVLTRDQLAALATVAVERDLWVLADEAYEHLLYDGAVHVSPASLPGMAERTVTAFTLSKSYAMTGWRVGYLHAPPALRGVVGPRLSFYSTHGQFAAVQDAALAAVTGPQDCVEQMRRSYDARRRLVVDGLGAIPGVRVPVPRGAFYAFPDVAALSPGGDATPLVDTWLERGVAVLPGSAFAPAHRGHVRVSLATKREDLEDAIHRLRG
jgi:aspartate aminotransferase